MWTERQEVCEQVRVKSLVLGRQTRCGLVRASASKAGPKQATAQRLNLSGILLTLTATATEEMSVRSRSVACIAPVDLEV